MPSVVFGVDAVPLLLTYFYALAVYYRFKLFALGVYHSVGADFSVPVDIVAAVEEAGSHFTSAAEIRDLFKCVAYTAARRWYGINGLPFVRDIAIETRAVTYNAILELLALDDLLEYIAMPSWCASDMKIDAILRQWHRTARASLKSNSVATAVPDVTKS